MAPKNTAWTNDLDVKLIEMVAAVNFLWDIQDPKYCRNDLKTDAWDKIAAELGDPITGSMAKERFANIKSTFQQNERKVKESRRSGAGTDSVYVPKWALYPKLTFLRKSLQQAGSTSNISSNQSQPSPNQTQPGPNQTQLNVYFDENMQAWQEIPEDIFDGPLRLGTDNTSQCSLESEVLSPQSQCSSGLLSPQSQCSSGLPGFISPSATSSQMTVPRPESAPPALPPRTAMNDRFRAPEVDRSSTMYTKRGVKQSKGNYLQETLLKTAVDTMSELTKQDRGPQDSLQAFGDYVVLRLREMPEGQRKKAQFDIWQALEGGD